MKTKKITYAAMLVAIGAVGGNLIYFPIGASKCTPVQHIINVIAAVTLGPAYAVLTAFCISLIRNITGTGTLLAFPGSMIGAFLAALLYMKTKQKLLAVIGEIIGTGIIGSILAFPIAKFILGKNVAAFFFVVPFLINTVCGSIIAYLILKGIELAKSKS
ncbi:energy coupling factor transporter S component ThiW [Clostridium sp. DJ247]|uniref:energy coupling factor transporter S component ThiW n=1 Tax=Clostridium sp. DJ247 TaxID=2726188 RepID=UPI001626DBD0|nr:energy coupling factor transporter S component ThiW [Clostridium sp. DJ247]MBC2581911.1 energy coupling factor transporter S component ThiW [Clostridium sp. DJ247]